MLYLGIALFITGVVLLVVGYRRNYRKLLVTAAIALFLSVSVGDFVHGFVAGFQHGWMSNSHAVSVR